MTDIICPTMPDWAIERGEDVVIRRWRKPDGAEIRYDDIIAELETRACTVEICAQADGILRITAPQGARVQPGAILGTIEQPNGIWPPPPVRS